MAIQKRDGRQLVVEAKQIAADHGLVVAEKSTMTKTGPKTWWCVYRKLPYAGVTWLGDRRSPHGLRSLVCNASGFR